MKDLKQQLDSARGALARNAEAIYTLRSTVGDACRALEKLGADPVLVAKLRSVLDSPHGRRVRKLNVEHTPVRRLIP
jgi:hypothetical protein